MLCLHIQCLTPWCDMILSLDEMSPNYHPCKSEPCLPLTAYVLAFKNEGHVACKLYEEEASPQQESNAQRNLIHHMKNH